MVNNLLNLLHTKNCNVEEAPSLRGRGGITWTRESCWKVWGKDICCCFKQGTSRICGVQISFVLHSNFACLDDYFSTSLAHIVIDSAVIRVVCESLFSSRIICGKFLSRCLPWRPSPQCPQHPPPTWNAIASLLDFCRYPFFKNGSLENATMYEINKKLQIWEFQKLKRSQMITMVIENPKEYLMCKI